MINRLHDLVDIVFHRIVGKQNILVVGLVFEDVVLVLERLFERAEYNVEI